jgi:hypothetical protein
MTARKRPTAAERAAAAAGRFGAHPPAQGDTDGAETAADGVEGERPDDDRHLDVARVTRIRRVRTTLLLTQHDHLAERARRNELTVELGEVTRQDLLEALVRRWLTDEDLYRKILSDLKVKRA